MLLSGFVYSITYHQDFLSLPHCYKVSFLPISHFNENNFKEFIKMYQFQKNVLFDAQLLNSLIFP